MCEPCARVVGRALLPVHPVRDGQECPSYIVRDGQECPSYIVRDGQECPSYIVRDGHSCPSHGWSRPLAAFRTRTSCGFRDAGLMVHLCR